MSKIFVRAHADFEASFEVAESRQWAVFLLGYLAWRSNGLLCCSEGVSEPSVPRLECALLLRLGFESKVTC